MAQPLALSYIPPLKLGRVNVQQSAPPEPSAATTKRVHHMQACLVSKSLLSTAALAMLTALCSQSAQATSVSILGGTINTGVSTTISTTPYTPAAGSSHFQNGLSGVGGRWQENGYFTDWSTTPTSSVLAWTFDSPAAAVPCGTGCTNHGLGTATVNFYVVNMSGYAATSYAADKAKIETGALFASFSGDFNHANMVCTSYPLYASCGSNAGTLHLTGGAAAPYLPATASFSLGSYYLSSTATYTQFGNFTASFVAATVPEPTTWASLALGLLLMGGRLRQRRA
jgi:PEP-CTERM motif